MVQIGIEFQVPEQSDSLVGFDIAGSEIGYPPSEYAEVISPLKVNSTGSG